MGNDFYASKLPAISKKYELTFILANIYTTELTQVLDELLRIKSGTAICLKLHPNQFAEKDALEAKYQTFDNVDVIASQKNMDQILSATKRIVTIQSTTVYEALHNNIKVFILAKKITKHMQIYSIILMFIYLILLRSYLLK
ncbi:hypothetical protein LWM68_21115 [Niabella sp. W65]|nr:hypothetical protein [Niabella sp. W65]MCH7365035.1 hypothetical protein [Niabella sp. W65]ULT40849.1 hypothetical protein KRR40_39995 [Niabella sp. I65]